MVLDGANPVMAQCKEICAPGDHALAEHHKDDDPERLQSDHDEGLPTITISKAKKSNTTSRPTTSARIRWVSQRLIISLDKPLALEAKSSERSGVGRFAGRLTEELAGKFR